MIFFFVSEMQEVIIVFHSSTTATLATRLCEDLNLSSFFTLPTSEIQASKTDINISNIDCRFEKTVEVINKILCLITASDTKEYVKCVEMLLNLKSIHEKIFLLCCTDNHRIVMPDGAYWRCFSSDPSAICSNSIKLMSKASGTCSFIIVFSKNL